MNQLSLSLDYLKTNYLGDNLAFVYHYGLDDIADENQVINIKKLQENTISTG
ncbi:hypothetical protein ACE8FZ_03960 [Peribacillus frigoritolerans]|uniref:hypothetical protein n=1 Tax=Peribacillus frigoritolerans TaxID=450367 RepID=UPI0035CF5676